MCVVDFHRPLGLSSPSTAWADALIASASEVSPDNGAMESTTAAAQADARTLDDLLARLREQEVVSGILLMGTAGTAALTPTSDYDLLLVFSELSVPLRMVTTWVDGRLTEFYCTTTQAVERVAANPSNVAGDSEEGTLVTWLREGRIDHDRDQSLATAQAHVRREPPPTAGSDSEIHEARRKISYNVAQLNRYLAADDPVSQVVVDLRLLYSLFEVILHYFTVRHLPWRGEKAAVRYWREHDPDYLALLRQCLAEGDRRRKAKLYETLAQRTLAPVGGLWERGTTTIATGAVWGGGVERVPRGTSAEALSFWQELIADDQGKHARNSTG